jgi:hypothetical protein
LTTIDLQLDGDGCWPDLKDFVLAALSGVALLPDGEVLGLDGKKRRMPILTLRVELADGGTALAQIKVEMLEAVLGAVRGRLAYLGELAAKGGMPS